MTTQPTQLVPRLRRMIALSTTALLMLVPATAHAGDVVVDLGATDQTLATTSSGSGDITVSGESLDSPTFDQYEGNNPDLNPVCGSSGSEDLESCKETEPDPKCVDGPGPDGVAGTDDDCLTPDPEPPCDAGPGQDGVPGTDDDCLTPVPEDNEDDVAGNFGEPEIETAKGGGSVLAATPSTVAGGGELPFTGMNLATAWLAGAGLVLMGGFVHLALLRRRRRA